MSRMRRTFSSFTSSAVSNKVNPAIWSTMDDILTSAAGLWLMAVDANVLLHFGIADGSGCRDRMADSRIEDEDFNIVLVAMCVV